MTEQYRLPEETAAEQLVTYESQLAERIAHHESEGNFLDASLLTYEHAELLAMLKQSPAARQLISTAIHLAQKDLELSTLAFEIAIDDIEFDPNIGILEAKHDLREALENDEETPYNLVMRLGYAYMAAAEKQPSCTQKLVAYSREPDIKNFSTQHGRKRRHTIGIDTLDGPIFLSNHSSALWIKNFGLHPTKIESEEWLSVYTPTESAEMITESIEYTNEELKDQAKLLLSLPDDPVFIPEQKIPNMDIFAPRHALLQGVTKGKSTQLSICFDLLHAYLNSAPKKLLSDKKSVRGISQYGEEVYTDSRRVCIIDKDEKEITVEMTKSTNHTLLFIKSNLRPAFITTIKITDSNGTLSLNPYKNNLGQHDKLAEALLALPPDPRYVKPS